MAFTEAASPSKISNIAADFPSNATSPSIPNSGSSSGMNLSESLSVSSSSFTQASTLAEHYSREKADEPYPWKVSHEHSIPRPERTSSLPHASSLNYCEEKETDNPLDRDSITVLLEGGSSDSFSESTTLTEEAEDEQRRLERFRGRDCREQRLSIVQRVAIEYWMGRRESTESDELIGESNEHELDGRCSLTTVLCGLFIILAVASFIVALVVVVNLHSSKLQAKNQIMETMKEISKILDETHRKR